MTIIRVQSLDMPALEPYRTLRRPLEHQRKGIFVAEGEKVVRRLLESEIETLSVLLTPEWLNVYQSLLETKLKKTDVFVAEKALVEEIVGFHLHQGIMAVGKIPKPFSLEQVLAQCPKPYLFVAIDGLTNAENLGVLVRNCAAFSVGALIVGETSSSPYLRRAVRNSMGTVFKLPIVQVSSLVETLHNLRMKYGVRSIAAHPHATTKTLYQANVQNNCCLVFGSEGEGVSSAVLEACDEAVAIPMHNNVDSLNVASASAVFLFEVRRQRKVEGRSEKGEG